MRISDLVALLNDIQKNHGDLSVKVGAADEDAHEVTGLWIRQDEQQEFSSGSHAPFVKLAVPGFAEVESRLRTTRRL